MLVTAVDVVDAANDNALLVPMLEQAEETTGTKSQMTLADAGYFAASHLEECARRDQQVVVSESRQFPKGKSPGNWVIGAGGGRSAATSEQAVWRSGKVV